ncbi:12-(S)-hydroxy-5,8,10,14-eicosatetraenoic acid receptor-like [Spinachia spinachia]
MNGIYSRESMSTNDTLDHCKAPNLITYKTLSWVMIGEFVLGLPLNLSVLYIFIFRFKFWKKKSIFLFNIVVADFLLVACLPAKAYYYYHGQRRSPHKLVCKMMLFMLFLNRGASIVFLITVSIDRYFNVVHLGRKNIVKVLKSPQVSIFIWLILLTLTIPTMVQTFECCNSLGRKIETPYHDVTDTFREIVSFGQIILPFIILVYCTVHIVNRLRRKTVGEKTKLRRAVWVVMSVVVVFSVCFLPSTLARVVLLSVRLKVEWAGAEDDAVQVYDSLMVLSYIDCLLDPLVYCFCNSGFKDVYISTLCPAFLRKRLLKANDGLVTTTTIKTPTTTTTTCGNRDFSLPILAK